MYMGGVALGDNVNNRRRKLLLNARYEALFRSVWTENQAWLDVSPVGREFGSKDYERLEQREPVSRRQSVETASIPGRVNE
jgi:hypothetical protein